MLATAFEYGIRYFDCARFYGHGIAERELGIFSRGRRDQLIIAAKIGIPAMPAYERWLILMYAGKVVGKISRSRASRGHPAYMPMQGTQDVAFANDSLRRTLAALGTSSVDILLPHEPPPLARLPAELIDWFIDIKRRGLRRWIGMAGEASVVAPLAAVTPRWLKYCKSPTRSARGRQMP